MNIAYILLTALMIAASVYIYALYNYMLIQMKTTFASELNDVLQSILNNIQPGQTEEAVIAVPQGVQLEFCPNGICPTLGKVCDQNCIRVTTPLNSWTVPVQGYVEVPSAILSAGLYKIKATYTTIDPTSLAFCKLLFLIAGNNIDIKATVSSINNELTQVNNILSEFNINYFDQISNYINNYKNQLIADVCHSEKIVIQIEKIT